ncbi:hypothetical protein OVY01_08155 [Robbsia sp. Bb-Pol-6]|uniref:Uncharacterized protein n=1 Tax=Robbsia betulipollinis TaxID=2981849 RepID=A0ABT3ZKZ2_9BURK|nr:hypothetical protein [Robbsia betulipollinis]MCY0387204.1 hypothetical protein [Robbsia betulipollinis]
MTIDPSAPLAFGESKAMPNADSESPRSLSDAAAAASATGTGGMSPSAMQKWMMQIMMTNMSSSDDDAPDASPTLQFDPDLF